MLFRGYILIGLVLACTGAYATNIKVPANTGLKPSIVGYNNKTEAELLELKKSSKHTFFCSSETEQFSEKESSCSG